MRESRTSGSVRGVAREGHPYLDRVGGRVIAHRSSVVSVLSACSVSSSRPFHDLWCPGRGMGICSAARTPSSLPTLVNRDFCSGL